MKIGLICRCRDEYFIEEFVNYYFNQGVNTIYIIDDDSRDKRIYNNLLSNNNVIIIFEKDIIEKNYVSLLYKKIKNDFEWIIYVDIDEFITTKRNINNTIRDELETTFKNAHCVKIPWVMMSCNSLKKSPKNLLETNVYRWNHDLRHVNNVSKFKKYKCRYRVIEAKCIFKPRFFDDIFDHNPLEPVNKNLNIIESISNKSTKLNTFYKNLREKSIKTGYLLCYHYRIISIEKCREKLRKSAWYVDVGNLQDLMSNDYAEIIDDTMKKKSKAQKDFINN